MKTIFHATIDGQEVVQGFGEVHGLIDPVATAAKIAPLLAQLPEWRSMQAIAAQIADLREQVGRAWVSADAAMRRGNEVEMRRQNNLYQARLLDIEAADKELAPIAQAYEVQRDRIWHERAEYFHPPQGETLIPDAQAAEMAEKMRLRGDGRALLLTGEYITDLRGHDFWLTDPWRHKVIDALGEELPAGAIVTDDLSAAQRAEIAVQEQADRIASLTPEERAAEAQRERDAALTASAQKRSELEIAGDKQALAKSQAAYQERIAEIDALYGAA